jgi:hypothetical protein
MNSFFPEEATLHDIEEFMRSVEQGVKRALANLAVALATIKMEKLYLQVANSWKDYIKMERTNLGYRESLKYARAGELFLRHQIELEEENIKLSDNLSKIHMIDSTVADHDPMYFKRLKSMSVRQLKDYNIRKRDELHEYPGTAVDGNTSVRGSSLYIGDRKVKGLSLNEAREKIGEGKRLVCVWVEDDDNEVRRVRRRLGDVVN